MSRLVLLEWQRTLGQRVSLVLADCLQSPRALRFCDLINQLPSERRWRPESVMGTLLKSVTEACGPGHKEALDSFYSTVKDAWLDTGEWWPPKKGPIHIDIEAIFSKLCIDLQSSLRPDQEETDAKNDSTEYLLVSLDFSISGANGMKINKSPSTNIQEKAKQDLLSLFAKLENPERVERLKNNRRSALPMCQKIFLRSCMLL